MVAGLNRRPDLVRDRSPVRERVSRVGADRLRDRLHSTSSTKQTFERLLGAPSEARSGSLGAPSDPETPSDTEVSTVGEVSTEISSSSPSETGSGGGVTWLGSRKERKRSSETWAAARSLSVGVALGGSDNSLAWSIPW